MTEFKLVFDTFTSANIFLEIFLSGIIIFLILFPLRHLDESFNKIMPIFTAIVLIICLVINYYGEASALHNSSGIYINITKTNLLKQLVLEFSLLMLGPVILALNLQKITETGYYILFLISILSALMLISANDLLLVYLIIEMQSLSFYLLTIFKKDSIFSIEAGTKYFIYSAIMSSILLFSLSFLYGATGTLDLHALKMLFYAPGINIEPTLIIIIIASILMLALFFCFKVGAAPFHFWIPDVYEGAPIGSTIIFSILPKIPLFHVLITLNETFRNYFTELNIIFQFIGFLTIFIGALFALQQKRTKRFIIYTSISQIGFPILLLGSVYPYNAQMIYLFLVTYLFGAILIWSGYLFLLQFSEKGLESVDEKESIGPSNLTDLADLLKYNPTWAIILAFAFFTLAGIPPFSVFVVKCLTLLELSFGKHYFLAAIVIFTSCLSTYYYIKVIKIIFFDISDLKRKTINYFYENSYGLTFTCSACVFCIIQLSHMLISLDFWLTWTNTLIL